MKYRFNILAPALLVLSMMLTSCSKEEDRLSITDVVAENHDNGTGTVPLGGTISVNFMASANVARLDFYHIEIHDHPQSGQVQDEYKLIDDDFRDISTFTGLREAHVHQHVVVPDTAHLGSYHVVITIVDRDGYSVNTEKLETHVEIVAE